MGLFVILKTNCAKGWRRSIELVLEAKENGRSAFTNEAADLLFHYLALLQARGLEFADIVNGTTAKG